MACRARSTVFHVKMVLTLQLLLRLWLFSVYQKIVNDLKKPFGKIIIGCQLQKVSQ